jgi:hypothetical protein
MRSHLFAAACCLPLAVAALSFAQDKPAKIVATNVEQASKDPDFKVQGEYEGQFTHEGQANKVGIQVIALGNGKFKAVGYHGGLPGAGWDKEKKHETEGETKDGVTTFNSPEGKAEIKDGTLTIYDPSGKKAGEAKRVERKSPTLGMAPPSGAVVVFDGSSLDNVTGGQIDENKLMRPKGTIKSKAKFQSCTIHLEFMLPYQPNDRGQGRANSGCYVGDRYECQILDSFGLKGENNECGGFYTLRNPDQNMCLPPLQWQTYDIEYTAPEFDADGKKSKLAKVTVKHNGVAIHENFELPKETPGSLKEGKEPGAVHLQDHGNPVMFRNVWVVEKK